eukprot:1153931-Pelagomonas_calceolata.AAC.8
MLAGAAERAGLQMVKSAGRGSAPCAPQPKACCSAVAPPWLAPACIMGLRPGLYEQDLVCMNKTWIHRSKYEHQYEAHSSLEGRRPQHKTVKEENLQLPLQPALGHDASDSQDQGSSYFSQALGLLHAVSTAWHSTPTEVRSNNAR